MPAVIDEEEWQPHYISVFAWLGIEQTLHRYTVVSEHELFFWNITPEKHAQNSATLTQLYQQTGKPLLLMLESNPFTPANYAYILTLAKTYDVPVKIFSSNVLDYFGNDPDLVYYPTWYCQQVIEHNYQSGKSKKFRFSFLSSQARFHRLYLYQQCKQWITAEDCVAVHANNYAIQQDFVNRDMQQHLLDPVDLLTDVPCANNVEQDSFYYSLPIDPAQVDFTNQHNAYLAMINITGESNIDTNHVFLSEKTWKPIRSRCLTMCLGNDHSVSVLNKLGFHIPESVDPELPLMEKISNIVQKMSLWSFDDCCTIYNDHCESLEHNQRWFYSNTLKQQFVDQIKLKLEIN